MIRLKSWIFIGIVFLVFQQYIVVAQDIDDFENIEKKIDSYLSYFSDNNPGAVVLYINEGKVGFNKAYGLSNVETKEINTTQKAFNLTGVSKSITSAAILKLVEKKKLSLETSLKEIFPEFPEYGRNIKIKNLLSHTSGLKNYNPDSIKTNNQVLEYLKGEKRAIFEAGTEWRYSNSDYALLVKIIEKVTKKSYNDYLSKAIFRKLKIKDTFLSGDLVNRDIAIGHFKEDNEYVPKIVINKVYGEQGIYSNTEDFLKWERALFTGKLLKSNNLSKIFSVYELKSGKTNHFYGFGWVLMEKNGVRYYWHGGSDSGYTNMVLHLPDTKTTVLVLSNRNDAYDFLRLAIQIAKEFDKNLKL